ncbi:hypothetical protein HYV88_05580 [Candidatus Woesearchaeota archaeon]|nr:hypothetical protein [Candidatus Woesearchaeota archaeon]
MEQELITKKIESIEKELSNLKSIILVKSKKNVISLKWALGKIKITEKEIEEAKRSLFNYAS